MYCYYLTGLHRPLSLCELLSKVSEPVLRASPSSLFVSTEVTFGRVAVKNGHEMLFLPLFKEKCSKFLQVRMFLNLVHHLQLLQS